MFLQGNESVITTTDELNIINDDDMLGDETDDEEDSDERAEDDNLGGDASTINIYSLLCIDENNKQLLHNKNDNRKFNQNVALIKFHRYTLTDSTKPSSSLKHN